MFNNIRRSPWAPVFLLVLVNALVYLPGVLRLGYYRDEWYFLYDALVGGRGIFWDMFLSDRPARGVFFELLFSLNHLDPFANQLLTLLWRSLGSLGTFWLVQLLWPGQRRAAWMAAVLFGVYPGFLWWVAGIEYQPIVLSATLMVFSFALSVKAFQAETRSARIGFTLGAIFSGWAYVALVEYATGMELFRFALFFLLVYQRNPKAYVWPNLRQVFRAWWINLVIPIGFLIWRVFLFNNERKATDLGLQLGSLFTDPLHVGAQWMINFIRSAVNVSVAAWVVPFQQNFYEAALAQMAIGLVVAVLVLIVLWAAEHAWAGDEADGSLASGWRAEMAWLGLVGLLAGILPVVAANRYITFDAYSHYSLPASLAGVLLVTAFTASLASPRVRFIFLCTLLTLAALSQSGLANKTLAEEKKINAFWWQVSWRAPGLRAGTTLAVNYPLVEYGEDYETVSGPANLIYYPQPANQSPVVYQLSAISLTANDMLDVFVGKLSVERTIRSHTFTIDYGNVLVISQPDPRACVHVLDPRWPDLSISEKEAFLLIAPRSKIENVLADVQPPIMPGSVFGREPEHAWCYFYQKADLARQQGDWEAIAALGDQVSTLGLHPNDQIEWMPFLQAQAFLGNEKQVKHYSTLINTQIFYKQQACRNLQAMREYGFPLSREMELSITELFCAGKQH